MRKLITPVAIAAVLALATQPVQAGWKRIETTAAADIGKGAMAVKPDSEWNRWSRRPSNTGEVWTKDGLYLNQLSFFGRIASGETIYKDRKKKDRPLPAFKSDMLLPDVAELFQSNFSIENDITQFEVTDLSPAKLGTTDGLKMSYEYALPGERLQRKGEARMAIHNGKLYIVNFAAPKLHYFDHDIAEVRGMMDRVVLK